MSLLGAAPIVVGWGATLYKVPAVRRRWAEAPQRSMWLGLLCLTVALSLDQRGVYRAVDHLLGLANVDNLLAYGLGLTASFFGQCFLWHSIDPGVAAQRERRRALILGVVLATMTVAFAFGPARLPENPDFGNAHASGVASSVYWLAFLMYALFALYEMCRLCQRFGSLAEHRSLSLGLHLVAAGGVLAALHFGYQYGIYLLVPTHSSPGVAAATRTVSDVLSSGALVGTGMLLLGSVLPAWSRLVGRCAPRRRLALRRAYGQLRPLWADLYRANHEIALAPPSTWLGERLALRDLDFRVYRRIVEISDGLLGLRPYTAVADRALARELARSQGLSGTRLESTVEAACLARALREQQAGVAVERVGASPREGGSGAVEDELAHWTAVAKAYRRSGLVQSFADRTTAGQLASDGLAATA